MNSYNSYLDWENDALVIIVNNNNKIFKNNMDGISQDQLRTIYLNGETLLWSHLSPIETISK
jgi:ABC-type phosphate transport system substrate-binding protein